MEALVRKTVKTLLFVTIFFYSVRYVHLYPVPMPDYQVRMLFDISDRLGIRDPEDLYVYAILAVNLVVSVVAYRLLIKLWRACARKFECRETS